MRLKLDETLGEQGRTSLEAAGHDVCTVSVQNLCSATDDDLIARCQADQRCLVSLDMDFANPLRYPPARHAGVAVLRLPSRPSSESLNLLIRTLVSALARDDLTIHYERLETQRTERTRRTQRKPN
jgi:predicted nuclease of predicted toxin-antitoxin system